MSALGNGVNRGLIILRGYLQQSNRLFLAIDDLIDLQQPIFTSTEQKILLFIDKDAVLWNSLLLIHSLALRQRIDNEIPVDVRTNSNETTLAEEDDLLVKVNVLKEIDILTAIVSQQFGLGREGISLKLVLSVVHVDTVLTKY